MLIVDSKEIVGDSPTRTTLQYQVRVPIQSDADVLLVRQLGRNLAVEMRYSSTEVAFIATAISELARTLLSHVGRGEMWLQAVHDNRRSGVAIVARDSAPDGTDDDEVHRDGEAEPPSLHLGSPDVYRLVDEFTVESEPGQGTTITAIKWRQ